MKKIGFLVYDVSLTGGAERVALNMAEEMSKQYEVHLISLFDEKKFSKDDKPYAVHTLSETTFSITTHIFTLQKRLKAVLKNNEIDILFVITAGVVTVAVMAARGLKIRTVYCEHSNLENKTYGKKHEFRQYIGAKYCDAVVALTERDRGNFIKKYKLAEERVCFIPNWFTPNTDMATADYNIESKCIISAGRLESVKGYDLLVKAAIKVKQRHPDWHWDIYGEGTYRKNVEELISANGLDDYITLMGNVNDLPLRYKNYALFVMTSYYEGLPLVLLEAQTAGLPIVSFDCPTGPAEIVTDSKNGYLVEPYDTDMMAEKICLLIESGELRSAFSRKAGADIDRFSKESVMELWNLLINKMR